MEDERSAFDVNRHWYAGKPFAMLSGELEKKSPEENATRTANLKRDLAKYNPIQTYGKGKSVAEKGEVSFFIPYSGNYDKFKQHMLSLTRKYGQAWVIVGGDGIAYGLDGNGQVLETFHKLVHGVDDAEDIWSELKGVRFRFESLASKLLERLGA